jgi:hypothetical protein
MNTGSQFLILLRRDYHARADAAAREHDLLTGRWLGRQTAAHFNPLLLINDGKF